MNAQATTNPVASARGNSQYASVEQIESVMGLPAESLSPIAWLMIQEESKGVKREEIAKGLGVTEKDLSDLQDATTGQVGQESQDIWDKGVIGLRAVALVNQQNIGSGWDAIEAIAVDKIARSLHAMKGPGDIDRMMQLATMANKAIRRGNGEGPGRAGSPPAGAGGTNVSIELNSGHLGTIRLNLSPVIAKQLSQPSRVIEGVKAREVASKTSNLEMLTLKDARKFAEEEADEVVESPLDEPKRYHGMIFDLKPEGPVSE
jgi:hypothetical protein